MGSHVSVGMHFLPTDILNFPSSLRFQVLEEKD